MNDLACIKLSQGNAETDHGLRLNDCIFSCEILDEKKMLHC